MNEAETRAELIDPALAKAGWGVVEGSKIFREYYITEGRIQLGGTRASPLKVDYILTYKNRKLAIVEAKRKEIEVSEKGVTQAKNYAVKLQLDFTYVSNGRQIYEINLRNGKANFIENFPSPEELWNKTFEEENKWRDIFNSIPYENVGGTKKTRTYQEIAIDKTMLAIAQNKQRILLTLATGTGKTFIAFQIAWKLFKSRWNLRRDGYSLPRILFLTDRNILANQAFNDFSAFPDKSLIRIKPKEIKKHGKVPTNGSVFFTIFQTFMSGDKKTKNPVPYFGSYPNDFFDFIIIDECHRGGANDEGNWRAILTYFSPAVQLGLTATPKRKDNVDTYKYFGEPVYSYSLNEGINDGYLTPFKIKRIQTTLDSYIYTSDDFVIEGDVEEGRVYIENDFNKNIEIKEREAKRVKLLLSEINQNEKTLVFCANQAHAAVIRDLINEYKTNPNSNYCVRVTSNDGEIGDQFLADFKDNEKSIPTILTTSQKLTTGVDARNVRNIVLLRPINSMIEFKQIIGRGTRLFDGKEYFTIYDFVDAYKHFNDPEWDGEPLELEVIENNFDESNKKDSVIELDPFDGKGEVDIFNSKNENENETRKMIKIKLRDGKEREIQHIISTSFWANGKPIAVEEFLENLFGTFTKFFKSEEELRTIWSNPKTRKELLLKLSESGYEKDKLETLQKLINAEKSDLFDVLKYVSFAISPITRESRVASSKADILKDLNEKQKDFIEFVLSNYIVAGVDELDQEKLPKLLELKYQTISEATQLLGGIENIKHTFISFQKFLYSKKAA